jgi:hypothetical protein
MKWPIIPTTLVSIAMPMAGRISYRASLAVRWAAPCLLAVLMLLPRGTAAAQAGISLSAATLEFWPEYDRPSMLVIFRGTLVSSVPLPATITLHIPAASKGPSAAAVVNANGQLVDAPFTTSVEGDTIAVVVQVQFASFQVEYYDPGLVINGETRTYYYSWTADFPVEVATLRVQEPADARNLKAEPPVALAGAGGLGLNYFTAALGKIAARQAVAVQLSYLKSSAGLTADQITPEAAAAVATAAQPGPQLVLARPGLNLSPEFWALGGASLLGLAVCAWSVWRLVRHQQQTPGRTRRARRTVRSPLPEPTAPDQFCTQCGHGVAATYRFCPNCGAPIRAKAGERSDG